MKNILIAVPQLEVHRPPISTAVIAGVIRNAGHELTVLDLNINLYESLGSAEYYSLGSVWESTRQPTIQETNYLNKFIDEQLVLQCNNNTRLMISVFTTNSQQFTKMCCERVLSVYPQCEIVLGGMGVDTFGEEMLQLGLCKYVIYGEGEEAILELMSGNVTYPGINVKDSQKQIVDIDNLSFPVYDDYDFSKYDYLYKDRAEVNIVGSRGCVRKCTYCNVATYWPKFRYRSGQSIADEMINHYEKHGVSQFYFTDSLINGSLKAFRDMCDKLANYNTTHNAGFKWSGQFIFKPKRQITDDYFDMIAAAGGDQFYVGVETGSDKIRWEMDKKFTNEDVDYHLEHFKRTGLRCFFLMIIGYLTETLEDHEDNLLMYPRWQKYVASRTISGIDLSTSLMFFPGTPLERMIDTHAVTFPAYEYNAVGDKVKNNLIWTSALNPELTFEERMRRRLEVHEHAMKYKWPIWRGPQRLESLYNNVLLYKNGIGKRIPVLSVN
jgi:hypothetical protein